MTDKQREELVAAARSVRENAYAPYSGFRVGAAVLGASGTIYTGCNVENVSYPVGLCAERGALAAAVAGGDTVILAVAIMGGNDHPCPPCGMCRQALSEFGPDMDVILLSTEGQHRQMTLRDLLPEMFGPDFLKLA